MSDLILCQRDDCNNIAIQTQGWCRSHYGWAKARGLAKPPVAYGLTLQQRFDSKYKIEGDCWVWQAARHPTGYGRFSVNRIMKQAHRISYELNVGPIPDDLVIDHLCRNRACVNPQHLEPVSQRINLLRGESPMAKTVRTGRCKRDHVQDETNWTGSDCRSCRQQKARERRLEQETANPALREARLEKLRAYHKSKAA